MTVEMAKTVLNKFLTSDQHEVLALTGRWIS